MGRSHARIPVGLMQSFLLPGSINVPFERGWSVCLGRADFNFSRRTFQKGALSPKVQQEIVFTILTNQVLEYLENIFKVLKIL